MTAPDMCAACGVRPAGEGHWAQFCGPCADLPYGVAAPYWEFDCGRVATTVADRDAHDLECLGTWTEVTP